MRTRTCLGALALLLAGCAASVAHREGEQMINQGNVAEGLGKLDEATRIDPSSVPYRVDAMTQRERIAAELVRQGDLARRAGNADEAKKQFQAALLVQPNQENASAGLDALEREAGWAQVIQDVRALIATSDLAAARMKVERILNTNPEQREAFALKATIDAAIAESAPRSALAAAYRVPVSLEFRDTPLRAIFEVLSHSANLNFVFDREVKLDQRNSIFLRDSTIEDALDFLMITNQLAYRPLNGNSVLVYPSDAAKRKDYEPLGVRAFYLLHTDAKTFAATLKTILKSKDVVVDDKLNMVVLHDSWDVIRLAAKLAALQDVAEPEVMLEVEVLEVARSKLIDLGVHWPEQVTLSALPLSNGAALTLSDLRHLGSSTIGISPGSATASANQKDTDADILANPRIRTHSRDKAKILIGERVPNFTSTATATGFVSESISYVDVGLKLEVEPVVYPDDEVSITIALEVSSITGQQTTSSGSTAYQIGTRNAQTVLRLKNNENQILAGLINDEDRRSANAIPLLGSLPLIGHLFGEHTYDKTKTEIVLSITPRILRNVPKMSQQTLEFEAGTETTPRSDVLRSHPMPGPAAAAPGSVKGGSPDVGATPSARGMPGPAAASASSRAMTQVALRGVTEAKPGDDFTVDVAMQSDQPIVDAPMTVGFDPKALKLQSIQPGKFLAQGGGTVSFNSEVDPPGQIQISTAVSNGTGGLSWDPVATIVFKVLPSAPPNTELRFLNIAPVSAAGKAFTSPSAPLELKVKR